MGTMGRLNKKYIYINLDDEYLFDIIWEESEVGQSAYVYKCWEIPDGVFPHELRYASDRAKPKP